MLPFKSHQLLILLVEKWCLWAGVGTVMRKWSNFRAFYRCCHRNRHVLVLYYIYSVTILVIPEPKSCLYVLGEKKYYFMPNIVALSWGPAWVCGQVVSSMSITCGCGGVGTQIILPLLSGLLLFPFPASSMLTWTLPECVKLRLDGTGWFLASIY